MKKSIVKVICFLTVFVIVMNCFTKVYCFKYNDGIYGIKTFYEQNNNINDVIFVGSSHIFENVNTEVLWNEYGIASFDLAGSFQPIWNSYYYIKEMFKSQTPDLIVLDIYGVTQEEDYIEESKIIKNTYGMKGSLDKIEAVKISSEKELWNSYLWEIPTYHMRYKELTDADFLPHLGMPNWDVWKGFGINPATMVLEKPEGFQTEETAELTEKVERYLRKICELCQERKTELLLIKTPYVTSIEATMKYNKTVDIAEEYGVSCIDFNYYYDEIGMDFSTDMADPGHLNYKGNVKFSRYLADYIKSNYDIPDRRGEKGFESYDIISRDCIMRAKNAMVYDTYDLKLFLEEIQDENYVVVYATAGDFKNASNYMDVSAELYKYGIKPDGMGIPGVWVVRDGNILFSSDGEGSYLWHMELAPYRDIEVKSKDGSNGEVSVIFNREEKMKTASGINIIVYDSVTETIVDAVGFPVVDGMIQYDKVR